MKPQKKTNFEIMERYVGRDGMLRWPLRWSDDGTYDVSKFTRIGKIVSIAPKMEVSFELKIENMDLYCYNRVLSMYGCFWLDIRRANESPKFYIRYSQFNGLGGNDICRQNPITFPNNWLKEFLSKILMVIFYKYDVYKFIWKIYIFIMCKNFKKY